MIKYFFLLKINKISKINTMILCLNIFKHDFVLIKL